MFSVSEPMGLSSPAMDTVIRELLPQQQPRTIERRDLQYITISKEELSSSDSLSPDPWKRDAREKAEKQQQLHIVDLLDKEIQELQVSVDVPWPAWCMEAPVCPLKIRPHGMLSVPEGT